MLCRLWESNALIAPTRARFAPTILSPASSTHHNRQRECKSEIGRQVVVVPLRINVNLKAATVEDLIGRRKVVAPTTLSLHHVFAPER